ncbi:coiled-coil domain-containing protein 191-like [Salvelinus fontinalis]|uniref:coiled-coil domain-containing protein 191-like n=1 Tax=Salvelinus fontinalis TaxID=8038 RepID=UPI002484EED9|nr:coiled-coil domain-containing protein 191-like [Salvelinus fontinalis]
MAYPHNPDIFRWKRVTKTKKPTADKQVQLNNGEINQWMKTVEMASDNAVSEVFSLKKPHSVISSQSMALHSTEQLLDHDQAYGEAQALLSDWMNSKLRLELEMEEEEDVIVSPEKNSPEAMPPAQPVSLDYSNFDDLYFHLAEEEESSAVNNFLQDLMEREVVDSGIVEDLALDSEERDRRMRRDPSLTMEARHRQVRENRARRDAERERLHRERVARRQAREEAQRREQEEERWRRQEARRQEEMVQQEMVRLRRETEERRNLEQLARQMERERIARKTAAKSSLVLQPGPSFSTAQKQHDTERPLRLQQAEVRVQMHNLKCLQRHFSGWYSVLLERRLQMGKAAALCDWRRQLRAWRDWRALVWAGREQREAERTEEELRTQKRHCQVAMVSDRRRLLRRCLSDWRLWCRAERERRELLSQQQETRRKMAALINAVATGKLKMMEETHTPEPITALPEPSDQSETVELKGQPGSRPAGPTPSPACQGDGQLGAVVLHTLPWQVTRRNAALSAGELRRARERGEVGDGDGSVGAAPRSHRAVVCGGRFEHRHASQQQTIAEQRRLLEEQQEQIARLQEEQSMMGLRQEAQTAAQIAVPASPRPRGMTSDPKEPRAGRVALGNDGRSSASRKPAVRQPCRHPTVMAMEERARQRAERRREVEELKRKKEEERLAQLKTAVKERQREEEDEKRRAVERRREEKRQEREREQEKQWRLERDQQLQTQAQQHYHKTLLLRRGLEPWKRLVAQSQANTQLARAHHRQSLLRRCTLSWQQVAGESLAQKWASADQLHQHILLRRSLGNWKRLKDHCMVLEGRAERFWRTHTLKRALIGLLDHATQERMADWDREQQAQEHSTRRAVRSCFQAWRRYPGWLREERERETRREQLRRRVAEVLPDFRSSPLDCTWEPGPL